MVKSLVRLIHEPIYKKRIDVLSTLIVPQLRAGDKILDVGCGSGMLGAAVLGHRNCPVGVTYRGLERAKRGGEPIEVIEHTTGPLPFEDREFDVVILADVLHHEERENFLIGEAARVCKRFLLIKDHKPEGFLGFWRICFLDWAANDPYGVKCLYRYHTRGEWATIFQEHELSPILEETSIDLYPALPNLIFGKRLQYFAVLKKNDAEKGAPAGV
jgi:ubiquinone/menaquinone biosynthesis C-methylase UbiE